MTEPETGHEQHIVVSDYFFGTTTNRRFEEMKAFFFSWCGGGTIAILVLVAATTKSAPTRILKKCHSEANENVRSDSTVLRSGYSSRDVIIVNY